MAQHFVNSYKPLVLTPHGRRASETERIPPFVDGSIRREPDLESPFPSISCLCRTNKFAPRLRPGDIVAYLTVKREYDSTHGRHRRLTAVLRVDSVFQSHAEAAAWYQQRALAIPSNCMRPDNPPKPISQSHRDHERGHELDDATLARVWDRMYRERANKFGSFILCGPIFIDLSWSAPVVHDVHLISAFGHIPSTQVPKPLPADQFNNLLRQLEVCVPPFHN